MSRRQSFLAYAALIVGSIAFMSSFARPLVGQQAAPAAPTVGRYQITSTGSSGYPNLYVIDTATGRTWFGDGREAGKKIDWSELKELPFAK
jgi:hypothetical protein